MIAAGHPGKRTLHASVVVVAELTGWASLRAIGAGAPAVSVKGSAEPASASARAASRKIIAPDAAIGTPKTLTAELRRLAPEGRAAAHTSMR